MVKVTGVRFRRAGKTYYFDPKELDPKPGEGVIVETARGMEYGTVSMPVTEVSEDDFARPLRPVVRIATEADIARHERNEEMRAHAMDVCREKIRERGLDMKLIDVSFTFDNNKIVFYFTSEGHVDFRDLVRDLASAFRMRIELRQVGARDEAKMIGGIGSCGRELCCASWLTEFQPVSIKMTKNQGMSMNPAKLSGACGRLMCCIKFENEVYQELRKGMPDLNENVDTDQGYGKVVEANILEGKVKVRLFTGEEDEYGRDKLTSEVYTFAKDQVVRLGKGRRPGREDPPKQTKSKKRRNKKENDDVPGSGASKNRPQDAGADAGQEQKSDSVREASPEKSSAHEDGGKEQRSRRRRRSHHRKPQAEGQNGSPDSGQREAGGTTPAAAEKSSGGADAGSAGNSENIAK